MSGKEFMMPVPTDAAAMQFFIEALKANTDVLRGMQEDLKADRKLLHDVRERVIRIESNRVDRRVEALEREVDALKSERDRREGANGAWNWLLKNLPTIGAIVVAIFATVVLTLRASGRL